MMWWTQGEPAFAAQPREFSREETGRWARRILIAHVLANGVIDGAAIYIEGWFDGIGVALIIAGATAALLAMTAGVAGLVYLVRRTHPRRRRGFILLWAELIAIAWAVQVWHLFFRDGGAASVMS